MWRSLSSVALIFVSALVMQGAQSDAVSKAAGVKVDNSKGDYILQPQDLIRVLVFQEDDLKSEVRISQECSVKLPLVETVDLTGKTARQAEEYIRDLYARDFLVKPQVQLSVLEYAPRQVSVFGAVLTPGVVIFQQEQGLNLLQAISRAGSFNRLANTKSVTLKRMKPDGTSDTYIIDVDDLVKGTTNNQWPLEPGDVIYVKEKIL